MNREIIVLGDIELGGGTLTDDFIADKTLSKLILTFARRENPVDLVLNGDTFDFLKCPYIKRNNKLFPRHITAEISHTKLHMIYAAHQKVFEALSIFAQKQKNAIYFIIGNHDQDLFFKEIQNEIKKILNARKNVSFSLHYARDGVYAEHGQQYDFLNKVDPEAPFIHYNRKHILNIPWVAFSVISGFLTMKEEHPFLERIKPIPVLFSYHKPIVKKLTRRSFSYVFKSMFYYPLRYFSDPTYVFPRLILQEIYGRWRKVHFEVDQIVDVFKSKNKNALAHYKVYVLGHIHEKYLEEKEGWAIIHPDTWRDEYILDKRTKWLIPKKKNYLHITLNRKDLRWKIVEIKPRRKGFRFYDVVQDELKYIQEAAKEEGYTLLNI